MTFITSLLLSGVFVICVIAAIPIQFLMITKETIMRLLIPILLSLFVMPLSWSGLQPSPGPYWRPASVNQEGRSPCAQSAAEQAAILRKAQNKRYSLRRIEFIGNVNIDDGTLRRRIMLQEGNVFARTILIKSLKSVSKLRTIFPVRLSDVLAHLNDEEKTIDVAICFREKQLRESKPSSNNRQLAIVEVSREYCLTFLMKRKYWRSSSSLSKSGDCDSVR